MVFTKTFEKVKSNPVSIFNNWFTVSVNLHLYETCWSVTILTIQIFRLKNVAVLV